VKPLKFLTSRSTVISLLTTISAALLFASFVPQRASLGGKAPQWVGSLPHSLQVLSSLLGLDNIVGSGWFATLVSLFWISLAISTVAQFSSTRMLVNRIPAAEVSPESIRLNITAAAFSELVKAAGYRLTGSNEIVQRYVKNRIGYWEISCSISGWLRRFCFRWCTY